MDEKTQSEIIKELKKTQSKIIEELRNPQLDLLKVSKKVLIEGWEVSPDRQYKFEQMLSTDDVGDPILTSKCNDFNYSGILLVSNKGIAWRRKRTIIDGIEIAWTKSSRWVRWHDVADIIPLRPGLIQIKVKRRKDGLLLTDKRGIPKTKNLKFQIERNKKETKIHFKQRKAEFFGIMMDLFDQYKSDTNPPTSDSRF